jgi:hypothetical protein
MQSRLSPPDQGQRKLVAQVGMAVRAYQAAETALIKQLSKSDNDRKATVTTLKKEFVDHGVVLVPRLVNEVLKSTTLSEENVGVVIS